jgi:hypothetical protein
MKVTIKLNGVKVEKEIPTSWSEVTFLQFLKLAKCENEAQKIALFTGLDEALLQKATINNLGSIISCLSFLNTPLTLHILPKTILGHKMPKNLEIETVGQYEDLKLEAAKIKPDQVDTVEAYTMFCAIYATNPYDYKQAEILKDYFLQAPCEEVMAIGNFTLMKLIGLNSPGLHDSQKRPSLVRNWKLATSAWLNRLAFTVRYYSWKRKLRLTERNF